MELKDLGGAIDQLYQARERRLDLDRQVKALKSEEQQIKMEILDLLAISGLAKASGHLATAGVKSSVIPIVSDWDKVHEFIRTNNRFDLLQKRVSVIAWRDLYDSGELVPGTESVDDVDLSLTKSVRT